MSRSTFLEPSDSRLPRRAFPIRPSELFQLLLMVVAFTFWSYRTNGQVSIREIAALSALVFVSFLVGQASLVLLRRIMRLERSFPLIWLTGLTIVGLVITLMHILTPIGLVRAFFMVGVLAMIGNICLRSSIDQWPTRRRTNFEGSLASVISLLAATFWLQHLFPQKLVTADTVQFRIFEEYYAHTINMMALLTPSNPFGVGSNHYAGEPLSFYHWACYSPAALLHLIGDQPANDTMASLWYPLAVYLLGLSAYVLGRVFFGSRAGLLATVGVVALPDPTYWSADIITFSFERLIEASAGMGYACGAAAVSLVFVIRGIRGRALAPIAGVFGAFASGLFKINIIAATLPATFSAILFFSRKRQRTRMATWIGCLILLIGMAVLAGTRLRSAPSFALDPEWGKDYVRWVLAWVDEGSWVRSTLPTDDISNPVLLVWGRSIFILFATFQLLLPLYGLLVIVGIVRDGDVHPADRCILASIAFYALLAVVLIPNANGDPFELQHRAFCWYYMLLIVGITGFVARWTRRAWTASTTPYLYIILSFMLICPLVTGRTMYIPSRAFTYDRGFFDSTEFIRLQSNRSDIVLDSQSDPWLVSTAMTERRAFVCYERNYNYPGSAALKDVREKRWEATDRLFKLTKVEQIRDWSRQHGVRWILLHPETANSWPAEFLAAPSFQSRQYRVYDLQSPVSENQRSH